MVRQLFPHLVNQSLAFIQTHQLPGKYRLYQLLVRSFPDKTIRHRLGQRHFDVPLDQWCFWLELGPNNYYRDEFIPFCTLINEFAESFTFFDLGADVGVVSSLVETHCKQLQRVIAVEPNPSAFALLRKNLAQFSIPCQALNIAVSDFNGNARLRFDGDRLSDHEGHIYRSDQGPVEVRRLDDLCTDIEVALGEGIVVKIDVEGEEIQTLAGAARTIAGASRALLLLELHPAVLNRTRATPEALFKAAESIREWQWLIPSSNNMIVNRDLAFYEQVPTAQYDVVGVSI